MKQVSRGMLRNAILWNKTCIIKDNKKGYIQQVLKGSGETSIMHMMQSEGKEEKS